MGDAYAELIRDRALLMLQVHAQSVADIPEESATPSVSRARAGSRIRQAASARETTKTCSGSWPTASLCHLLVTARIE